MENIMEVSEKKIKIALSYDSVILLLDIYSKNMKAFNSKKDMCTINWSINYNIQDMKTTYAHHHILDKEDVIYTHIKYYSARKQKRILPLWPNAGPEGIMLSEICEAEKDGIIWSHFQKKSRP